MVMRMFKFISIMIVFKSIPVKCPKPQNSPIFQTLRLVSIANGVTAARWSGPETTCRIEAARPANKGKVIIDDISETM